MSYLRLQVCHVLGEVDEALDGGQDDARVGGAQNGVEVVEQADGLVLAHRVVAAHQAQHLGEGRQGREGESRGEGGREQVSLACLQISGL
jgi:hypothetical protein